MRAAWRIFARDLEVHSLPALQEAACLGRKGTAERDVLLLPGGKARMA